MKSILLTLIGWMAMSLLGQVYAQQLDSVPKPMVDSVLDSSMMDLPIVKKHRVLDSATLARMQFVTDSTIQLYLYVPVLPYQVHPLLDSVEKQYLTKNLNLFLWFKKHGKIKKINEKDNPGILLKKGERWLPIAVLAIFCFFIVLRQIFGRQIGIFLQAFYSNRQLQFISKDDNLFNSWLFLWMYVFFGLSMGMFLCLTSRFFSLSYPVEGVELLLLLSSAIIGVFAVKILILRMIGFVFDFQNLISEYVSILYLTYFNYAILLLPLVTVFCFSPLHYGKYFIIIGVALLVSVLIFQLLRASFNILSKHKLGKFYLFLYICALEICPVLIIIKALAY